MKEIYLDRKHLLLTYLQYYLSKRLNMNEVFLGIKSRLNSDCYITERQFNSIIKFVERERQFKTFNRKQIKNYFKILIGTKGRKVSLYEPNTLY